MFFSQIVFLLVLSVASTSVLHRMFPRLSIGTDAKKSVETTKHDDLGYGVKATDTSVKQFENPLFVSKVSSDEDHITYDNIYQQEEDVSILASPQDKLLKSFLSDVNKMIPSFTSGKALEITRKGLGRSIQLLSDVSTLGELPVGQPLSPRTKYSLMLVSSLLMAAKANPSATDLELQDGWDRFILIHLKLMGSSTEELNALSDRETKEIFKLCQPLFDQLRYIPGLAVDPSYLMSGVRAIFKFASSVGSLLKSAFQGKRNEETSGTVAIFSEREKVNLMRGAAMGILVQHFKKNGFFQIEQFKTETMNIVNSCSRETKALIFEIGLND